MLVPGIGGGIRGALRLGAPGRAPSNLPLPPLSALAALYTYDDADVGATMPNRGGFLAAAKSALVVNGSPTSIAGSVTGSQARRFNGTTQWVDYYLENLVPPLPWTCIAQWNAGGNTPQTRVLHFKMPGNSAYLWWVDDFNTTGGYSYFRLSVIDVSGTATIEVLETFVRNGAGRDRYWRLPMVADPRTTWIDVVIALDNGTIATGWPTAARIYIDGVAMAIFSEPATMNLTTSSAGFRSHGAAVRSGINASSNGTVAPSAQDRDEEAWFNVAVNADTAAAFHTLRTQGRSLRSFYGI